MNNSTESQSESVVNSNLKQNIQERTLQWIVFMYLLVVDEVAGIVESFITVNMRASVRFDSTVPIQVSLKSLATGKLFATDFTDVFTIIRVRLGVAITVAQASERFAADGALEWLLFGVCSLVSRQVALFTETHPTFVAFRSKFTVVSLVSTRHEKNSETIFLKYYTMSVHSVRNSTRS